jgi:hypothetical protein
VEREGQIVREAAMWTLLLLAVTFALAVASYVKRFGKPANFPPG